MPTLRSATVAATVLLIAFVPGPVQGQSDRAPWSVAITAAGGGYFVDKTLGQFADGGGAALRPSPVAEVGALVRTPIPWLRVRANLTRTVDLSLARREFSHSSSCGHNCFQNNYSFTPIPRDVSALYASSGVELAPLHSSRVGPYLSVGYGLKRLAFGDGSDLGLGGLEGSTTQSLLRASLGVEIPVRFGALRFEATDFFGTPDGFSRTGSILEQLGNTIRHDIAVTVGFAVTP